MLLAAFARPARAPQGPARTSARPHAGRRAHRDVLLLLRGRRGGLRLLLRAAAQQRAARLRRAGRRAQGALVGRQLLRAGNWTANLPNGLCCGPTRPRVAAPYNDAGLTTGTADR